MLSNWFDWFNWSDGVILFILFISSIWSIGFIGLRDSSIKQNIVGLLHLELGLRSDRFLGPDGDFGLGASLD